ncbi:kinase [Paenibacillus chartarius]|uniref:Kinase n=1 Tax=Paenibacillus chartarius TaxID=747481 RepID=A0ABV6DNB6_9BACL
MNHQPDIAQLLSVLFKSWSLASSSKWTAENPAKGQCGVTALVVNDLWGGEIVKTTVADDWHYYNNINGKRYDLTASQFSGGIQYLDIASNREEAFNDTNEAQYSYLKQRVGMYLVNGLFELQSRIGQCKGRFIVGIDGLSRSGKTTYVEQIRPLLENNHPVHVFHLDDYIVSRKHRYDTGYEPWYEYFQLQWDVDGFTNNFFQKLKVSRKLELQRYISESDSHVLQLCELQDLCVIIVEGVFLQREEWKPYFDYVIYLDCPRDKRFLRENPAARLDIDKFEKRYWAAEEVYLRLEPAKQADLVIAS